MLLKGVVFLLLLLIVVSLQISSLKVSAQPVETKEVNFDKIKARAIYSKSLNLEESWRIDIQLQNPLKRHYILTISLSIIEPYGTT
jgi:hypothetical protein